MITIYSKPSCVQCDATYRALTKHELEYTVVDVTTNPAALTYVTEELGYNQAPIVVVDDQDHWSGYNPGQIKRLAAHLQQQH